MKRKENMFVPTIGGTSLLVMFAVLCLTVFALLTLGTVQADRRLSNASLKASVDYYAADVRAETIFAQIRQGDVPEGVTVENDTYAYSCPISETQALAVEVTLNGSNYTVLRWQAVSTAQWDPDNSLPVWDGET
jgi:hypothetical protein